MYPKISLENLTKIVYVGTSMYPLLRDLDMLYFAANTTILLKPGDVIVFKSKKANKDINVTHRIISIEKSCLITKGDNNPHIDDIPVNPSDIIGLVIYAKRGNRLIRVRNGKTGMLLANAIQLLLRIKTIAIRVISYPYNWVSKTGILRRFVPRNTKQRVINLQRPGGIESHFLIGKYLAAKRRPGSSNWTILPPFKLFIDEKSLPAMNTANDLSLNDNEISI